MYGKKFQCFFFIAPVFQDLARQFHKIPIYGSTREAGIYRIGQHAVQSVPKFMEQGSYFVKGEQGGLGSRGFGEITDIGDMGSVIYAVLYVLRFVGGHPCTPALSRSGVKIGITEG